VARISDSGAAQAILAQQVFRGQFRKSADGRDGRVEQANSDTMRDIHCARWEAAGNFTRPAKERTKGRAPAGVDTEVGDTASRASQCASRRAKVGEPTVGRR